VLHSYSALTAVRHHFRDIRSNEREGPPRLPSAFDPFLNSIEQIKSLGYEDLPSPRTSPSSTLTVNGFRKGYPN
jgi:hypothetical protein